MAQNRPLWRLMSAFWRYAPLVVLATQEAVAAPAIDKAGPRPYHFCPGPTSGPTTRPQEVKEVKIRGCTQNQGAIVCTRNLFSRMLTSFYDENRLCVSYLQQKYTEVSTERLSARMPKITNDGLSPQDTLYLCTHMTTVSVKGLNT